MKQQKLFESPLTALKWTRSRGMLPPTRQEIIDTDKKGRQYWRTVYVVDLSPHPTHSLED